MNNEYKKSLFFLFQWMVISVAAGIAGSLMVVASSILVSHSSRIIQSSQFPFPLWTIGGALLCGIIFYRISPTASGDGIPSYIRGVLDRKGKYSLKETGAKLAATLTALMTMSIGGMLAPSGRISAGLNSSLAELLRKAGLIGDQKRTAAICGMSAVVGAVFHSPVGGGIFAVEVLQRSNMRYHDLFPAVLSSSIAVYIYNFFPFDYPLRFNAPEVQFHSIIMPFIIVTSLAAALIGRLYTLLFEKISYLFSKGNRKKTLLKLFWGATISSLLVYIFDPSMAGNIRGLGESLFSGAPIPVRSGFVHLPFPFICLIFIIIIALASSISIGSGISVGLTSPSILIGLFLGALMADLFGFTPDNSTYYFFLVTGFSGLLSSSINVPIGAAVIAIETFGASYGFCAGVSSIIGFQVNRHHTLYDNVLKYTD